MQPTAKMMIVIAVVTGVVGFVILMVRLSRRQSKERREALASLATTRGWRIADKAERESLVKRLEGTRLDKAGRRALTDAVVGRLGKREAFLGRHQRVVSTGQSTSVILHAALVCDAPAGWPSILIARENVLTRLMQRFGAMKDLTLDLDRFNESWRLKTDDPDFAMLLLSPEAQELILEGDDRTFWVVGEGRVMIARLGDLKPEVGERLLGWMERFWALVPRELLSYPAAGAG